MSGHEAIRPGQAVVSSDGIALGTVEAFDGAVLHLPGWDVPVEAVARSDEDTVYLALTHADFAPRDGTIPDAESATRADQQAGRAATAPDRLVIPLAEERLQIAKREVVLGEIVIRKRVVEEQRMVPITIRREEVDIVRLAPGEPLPDGWEAAAAGELTRIPFHSSEETADVAAYIDREVVVERRPVPEEQRVTGVVRRGHVDVDMRYRDALPDLERDFVAQFTAGETTLPTFNEAEPQYRAGFAAGTDPRYDGQDFATAEEALRREHGTGQGDTWEAIRRRLRTGFEAARR